MASNKELAEYIIEQFGEGVTSYKMMGEYVLYIKGKVFGGIYDDRLLVKVTDSSKRILENAPLEIPYESAKPMLMVEAIDNRELLRKLAESMYNDLPEPKPKRKKTK